MHAFIALLSLAAVASAGVLNVENCANTDTKGALIEVSCKQFEDGGEVIVKRGETYDFTISFKAGENAVYIVPEIYGVIAGIQVPWQGVPTNGCPSLSGNQCPIVSGQEYSYTASVSILKSYPAVPLTFRWSMVSADASAVKGNKQICFTMPARITN